MSILDRILGKSQTLKSKKTSSPKKRRLGFEGLENRELLSVSATEFASIRSQYANLELSTNMNDYNIIEIAAGNLSDMALKNAVTEASNTAKRDLIVLRTTDWSDEIWMTQGAVQGLLQIDADFNTKGEIFIVSYGSNPLTIVGKSDAITINVSNRSVVGLGGVNIIQGRRGIQNNGTLNLDFCSVSDHTYGGIDNAYGGTLTIDRCDVFENESTSNAGGIGNLGTLTIRNSRIYNNTASSNGGGVYSIANTHTTISDSEIYGNKATTAGGFYITNASVKNTVIKDNTATNYGGGGYVGDVTLEEVVVTGNKSQTGGGLYVVRSTSVVRSRFSGNEADTGGGIAAACQEMIVCNSVFSGNLAARGGGLFTASGMITLANVTIAGNMATQNGGGIWNQHATTRLNNSIVAKNISIDAPDLYTVLIGTNTTKMEIANTLLGNASTGTGRSYYDLGGNFFNTEPRFIYINSYSVWNKNVAESWNLALTSSSFAINAGLNILIPYGVTTDILGNARIFGGTVDMGAYEYQSTSVVPATPATAAAVSASGNVTKISWSKVDGATSYDIMGYNKAGNYWWKIDSTTNTSYNAPAYTANVTTIAVHAVNSAGRSTGKTASIFRAPTTVSAVAASGNQTKISWNAVAGATSYEILGYNKAGNYWWKIGTTNKTSHNAPAYTANVTTIAVHAIRGNDRTSGAATSIFRAPASVSVVAASATQTKITWNAVAGATSYDIMGYNKAGNYWWKIDNVKGTSYSAQGYSTNVTTIAIHAIRASDRTAGTTAPVVRAPSNVTATSLSPTSIRFSWNAAAGATRYELVIYNSVTKKWSTLTSAAQNTYTATNLAPGVTQVSVHAVNAAGRSAGATATVR